MTTIEKMTDEEMGRLLAEKGMGYSNGSIQYAGNDWWYIYRDEATGGDECWNPLTDANDMLMLIEAIFKRFKIRTHFALECDGACSAVCLSKAIPPKYGYATDILRAVCLAAAKALAAEKEQPHV